MSTLTLKKLKDTTYFGLTEARFNQLKALAREALQAKQREPDCWVYRKHDPARDEVTYHVLWPGEEQNHDNDPLALYAAPHPQGKDSNER